MACRAGLTGVQWTSSQSGLTTVCGVVSELKNVQRATMIPQGRTIICSLCVRRLPNIAQILWIPVSDLSGHDDGSSCASPTSISSISSAINMAASESMGLATFTRCSLPCSWKNAIPCCVCRFPRAACSGMSHVILGGSVADATPVTASEQPSTAQIWWWPSWSGQ